MALRLDTAVIKGELDNTERGRVRGRLWLLDREEPVILDLEGDPWRDLAGMKVTFTNPSPQAQESATWLKPSQTGSVGDITASRKVRVFMASDEEWQQAYREDRIREVPTEWKNSLYLEWFSHTQGRCVIETTDFDITVVGEPAWHMDEDEEAAQRLANMHSMRTFMETIIQRAPPPPEGEEEAWDDSEDAWEEQLKASDRLLAANLEATEKYGEDDDADEKTAFVMGWDNVLACSPSAEEAEPRVPSENDEAGEPWQPPEIDPALTHEGFGDDENWPPASEPPHPLKEFSRELVLRMMRETRASGLDDSTDDRGGPLDRFIANVMQISGKLAAALGPVFGDARMHNGYTLAITRRCLNWANEALAAMDELLLLDTYAQHRPMLEGWRAEVFKLREGISDLRRELRATGEE